MHAKIALSLTALALSTALLSPSAQAGTGGVPLKYNNEDFPVYDYAYPHYPLHSRRYFDAASGQYGHVMCRSHYGVRQACRW
jgi:hypothetical protein